MNRHLTSAIAAALALAAATPTSPAQAQELALTAQAVAAHAEFLTQAPPPPVQGVLCLVDSGVDLNPDTEPNLIGRESVFDGTVDDVTPYHHGTYVAMVAGRRRQRLGHDRRLATPESPLDPSPPREQRTHGRRRVSSTESCGASRQRRQRQLTCA